MKVDIVVPKTATGGGPTRLATIAHLLSQAGHDVELHALKNKNGNVWEYNVPITTDPPRMDVDVVMTFADDPHAEKWLSYGHYHLLFVMSNGVDLAMEKKNILDDRWVKISTTQYLADNVKKMGQPCVPIGFGLDELVGGQRCRFSVTTPVAERYKTVCLMHHNTPRKGFSEGVQVLKQVNQLVEHVHVFGQHIQQVELDIESSYTYHYKPSPELLQEIYNQSAVFLWPSHTEGLGMPPLEALLCGCGVATVDNGGSRELLLNGETALVSKVGDVRSLAHSVGTLLVDPQRRLRYFRNFRDRAEQYTWNNSINKLLGVIYELERTS